MTSEQKERIEDLESVKRDIQDLVYPDRKKEGQLTAILAIEDRQKKVFEGRV
jgi:hypothetical protein